MTENNAFPPSVAVEWQGGSFRGQNTGSADFLISIKQKRFVKVRGCMLADAKYSALVYPAGRYLEARWIYWNKRRPSHTIVLRLITYLQDANVFQKIVLKSIEFCFDDPEDIPDHPAKPLVAEVFRRRPKYHGVPDLSPTPAPLPPDISDLFRDKVEIQE